MNARPLGTDHEMQQLKALLFQPEAARIEILQTTVDALDKRLGSTSRLEAATAEILVEAFRTAETTRHRDLAQALAPVLIGSIHNEIRNSREMMIEALYPIMGRLVMTAIANAMRDLVSTINERMDKLLSTRRLQWRLKSLASGRPISEVALAEAQRARITRLLFIERGSGILLADWARDGRNSDKADLMSGLIAAIMDFSNTVLADQSGELRTLDLGASRIVLRGSPRMIIAAQCEGPLRPEDERTLDVAFMGLLEQQERGQPVRPATLATLAGDVLSPPTAFRGGVVQRVAWWLCAALVVGTVGLLAGHFLVRWRFETGVKADFASAILRHPAVSAYPLNLVIDHTARTVTLRGLVADAHEGQEMLDAIRFASRPYAALADVAVVSSPQRQGALEQQQRAMERRLAAIDENLAATETRIAQYAATSTDIATSTSRSQLELRAQIASETAATGAAITSLRQELNMPLRRLQHLFEESAVFFAVEDTLRDDSAANALLGQIAELLQQTPVRIRIVGHTDDAGTQATNKRLARLRAEAVFRVLVERGVKANRIVLATRSAYQQIVDDEPPAISKNRRVTFEVVSSNEPE